MLLVATEDELSEAVVCRLVIEAGGSEAGVRAVRKNGYGYLRRSIDKFCETARRAPVVVLTDLDAASCPPALMRDWFGAKVRPPNLVFRVAVREVEAWLLADREGMGMFLHISPQKIDAEPESLQDPKQYLLRLARSAPRDLRDDLLPMKGAAASQGFGYNSRLCEFIRTSWSAERASGRSPSLAKASRRIREALT
ncbi:MULTISPECIES: DUF4276 family protein [Methylosinus]|uniref:DUF4276 domain-containing protein n=1 Tax=Methylosinus trichosporium (strain ATCC 35070 / NCIMB 11131 / UNIQEM 75 / OB3b) TaxID=595536 RepID=A0A2D2D3E8_METT3|nr:MULTISPECIES: DUF4276 family protein [Methylosinus]ATQ69523.1 DUF4276 domain-containing protein [Methylosinus trichosporium OB3b]OBS50513.1 hypothetical protein A8B73_21415 [Methylosinus sp. 3S-1]